MIIWQMKTTAPLTEVIGTANLRWRHVANPGTSAMSMIVATQWGCGMMAHFEAMDALSLPADTTDAQLAQAGRQTDDGMSELAAKPQTPAARIAVTVRLLPLV